jgi:hypothetical protein
VTRSPGWAWESGTWVPAYRWACEVRGSATPACAYDHTIRPEQSKPCGPAEPQMYGLPRAERAAETAVAARVPVATAPEGSGVSCTISARPEREARSYSARSSSGRALRSSRAWASFRSTVRLCAATALRLFSSALSFPVASWRFWVSSRTACWRSRSSPAWWVLIRSSAEALAR